MVYFLLLSSRAHRFWVLFSGFRTYSSRVRLCIWVSRLLTKPIDAPDGAWAARASQTSLHLDVTTIAHAYIVKRPFWALFQWFSRIS